MTVNPRQPRIVTNRPDLAGCEADEEPSRPDLSSLVLGLREDVTGERVEELDSFSDVTEGSKVGGDIVSEIAPVDDVTGWLELFGGLSDVDLNTDDVTGGLDDVTGGLAVKAVVSDDSGSSSVWVDVCGDVCGDVTRAVVPGVEASVEAVVLGSDTGAVMFLSKVKYSTVAFPSSTVKLRLSPA